MRMDTLRDLCNIVFPKTQNKDSPSSTPKELLIPVKLSLLAAAFENEDCPVSKN
jgi:hypothetical protein